MSRKSVFKSVVNLDHLFGVDRLDLGFSLYSIGSASVNLPLHTTCSGLESRISTRKIYEMLNTDLHISYSVIPHYVRAQIGCEGIFFNVPSWKGM